MDDHFYSHGIANDPFNEIEAKLKTDDLAPEKQGAMCYKDEPAA